MDEISLGAEVAPRERACRRGSSQLLQPEQKLQPVVSLHAEDGEGAGGQRSEDAENASTTDPGSLEVGVVTIEVEHDDQSTDRRALSSPIAFPPTAIDRYGFLVTDK